MAGKLTGNGMWESSRIMLPEHKEAIIKFNDNLNRRERIELDEQEIEQIGIALQQSKRYGVQLSVKMYHPFERLQIVGIVEDINQRYKQFKVNGDWFDIADVEGIEVDFEPC